MLVNLSFIASILIALCTLTTMTVSSFLYINKCYKDVLNQKIIDHDEKIKLWIKLYFEDYYSSLNDKITDLSYRVKNIEDDLK